MSGLIIKNITKTYKGAKNKANDNISLSLSSGSLVAFTGHNGAGKTTLLNQIMGNVKPDSGDIIFENTSLVKKPDFARHNISIMPQLHAPLEGVSVKEAITAILKIRGFKSSELSKILRNTLVNLDIEKWESVTGENLSGGLRRLTSFAMATSSPQKVLLLDEPTNDVDPLRRKLIWRRMKELARSGRIVVVVTHNLLEVEQYADRYVVFNKGTVVQDSMTGESVNGSRNTLIVDPVSFDIIKDELPAYLEYQYIEEEGRLVLNLSNDQINDSVAWLVRMIEEKKVLSYRLAPLSLEMSYGGYTK